MFYSIVAGHVGSKSRFHVSVGHATVMAELTFFGLPEGQVGRLVYVICNKKTVGFCPGMQLRVTFLH